MKMNAKHLLSIALLGLLCSCMGKSTPEVNLEEISPTSAPEITQEELTPTTTPFIPTQVQPTATMGAPDKVEGAEVMLWAVSASGSSSAGDQRYHADQAFGEPNTRLCGDFVTAWQPAEDAFQAILEVELDLPILPAEVHVAQSFQPGQITRVDVITVDGDTLTIYDTTQDSYAPSSECPLTNVFWMPDSNEMINRVRLTIAREESEPWTQIDAVGVRGWVTDPLAVEESAPQAAAEEDFYEPVYFINTNRVTSLAFAEDILWAGSEGGVVAWDLEAGTYTTYTASDGLPRTYISAIAAHNNVVYAGSSAGVASLSLDGAPYFALIDHPGDEAFGDVTALKVDDQRGYLWVGYIGHLSRYDISEGSWMEFGRQVRMPDVAVQSIALIGEDVWAATSDGIVVLYDGTTLVYYPPVNSVIPSASVNSIVEDLNGWTWLVNAEGLMGHDPEGGTWTFWKPEEITGGHFTTALIDLTLAADGTLWIADNAGNLCQFDPESISCQQSLSLPDQFGSPTALAVNSEGWVAVGSLDSGVQVYRAGEWKAMQTAHQVVDNAYWAIAATPDGQIWLAGETTLQHFEASRPDLPWEVFELPGAAIAHSFNVTNDGLWIGHTQGALFLPYLPGEARIELPVGDPEGALADTVTAIAVDGAGRVYFGTSSGLSIWDGTAFQYYDLLNANENDAPPQVNALYPEGETMRVGAANGLFTFESGAFRSSWTESLESFNSEPSRSVGVISLSPEDSGLLVGIGRDLFIYTGISFNRVLTLPSDIRSLYVHPNLIWLATASSGVYSVPVDTSGVVWGLASKGDGFSDYFGTQAIVMSDAHTVWLASLKGGLLRQRALWGQ